MERVGEDYYRHPSLRKSLYAERIQHFRPGIQGERGSSHEQNGRQLPEDRRHVRGLAPVDRRKRHIVCGDIDVPPEPGKGAAVKVVLPMRRGEDMTGVEDTFGELVALLKACACSPVRQYNLI